MCYPLSPWDDEYPLASSALALDLTHQSALRPYRVPPYAGYAHTDVFTLVNTGEVVELQAIDRRSMLVKVRRRGAPLASWAYPSAVFLNGSPFEL